MIVYQTHAEDIRPEQLAGFFEGWPNPPSPETHLRMLRASARIVLAIDCETSQVVGFITAISDGILSAYLPLLEVLPSHRRRGIAHELVRRMIEQLHGLYMIDLLCDPDLQPFYDGFGMIRGTGMMIRNYMFQAGTVPVRRPS